MLYRCKEKMVDDEDNRHYGLQKYSVSTQHRLIHDFHPAFLGQDLKHGHKGLIDMKM